MTDRIEADSRAVHRSIAELARTMHNATGDSPVLSPDQVLQDATFGAVQFVPAVDHAGVTLIRRRGGHRTVRSAAATGDIPKLLDALQEELDDGPCLRSAREHDTVRVTDFGHEKRWPSFARAVVDRTPVRSSLSIRLYTDHDELGALNVYSERVDGFGDDAADQLFALAAHTAVALSSARRSEQFHSALASRDLIGQAKGMIMERYNIGSTQAFTLLSKLSQDSNTPVTHLARQLIDAQHPDA
ncbi:ANTAR domain-containing protein [Rhodococcus sp. Eu-32]|uniref:GAF and ANTAR domain-containing protein n=1 Tax=Rhodococcus sp. Eu-32 TaxID=1017319 RepID=UPI000DF306F7|nr:GAF and ANTAR domain-containing protein [Rhodococcus sp. Eu-32]RRQ25281.1 ANTAR domain-containing protein [Rhodococcus sp. Eu-32]